MATLADDDLTQPLQQTTLQLFGPEVVHVNHNGYDRSGNLHLEVSFGTWRARLLLVGEQPQLVDLLHRMLTVASEAPSFNPGTTTKEAEL